VRMCSGREPLQRIEAKRREQGKQRIHKEPRTASWKDFTKGNSEKKPNQRSRNRSNVPHKSTESRIKLLDLHSHTRDRLPGGDRNGSVGGNGIGIHGTGTGCWTSSWVAGLARGVGSWTPAHLGWGCHLGSAAVGTGGHRAGRAGVGRVAVGAAAGRSLLGSVAVGSHAWALLHLRGGHLLGRHLARGHLTGTGAALGHVG